jgi:hypothetical protein
MIHYQRLKEVCRTLKRMENPEVVRRLKGETGRCMKP